MKKVEVDLIQCEKVGEVSDRKYSEIEIIDILYKNLKPVSLFSSDSVVGASKYVKLATEYNYDHYRLCTVQSLKELGVFDSLSFYRKNFFTENGAVVAIFNELNDNVASVVFRAISSKAFMDYSVFYTVYGINLLKSDFKYGDTIVLTEGIYDADSLRPGYPNVLAMLTSNITVGQAEVLKTLTNQFIVLFDSDDAGESGYNKSLKRLIGCKVQKIPVFVGDKDVGNMEEYRNNGKLFQYQERFSYYKSQIDYCINSSYGESVFDL